MPQQLDFAPNIAVFADFENVAIGVREAKYDRFDIQLALKRLLDKGKIVVKKAYADWERYKSDRRSLHEAAFELIEIPHVSYSGKNSADIRMVVDALDLCYTKTHVDVFCIISGDSDFSPLVSKLRENNKQVIGLGVRNSSSDLLIENCDEFIYYDDLVRGRGGRRKGKKPRTDAGKVEAGKADKDASKASRDGNKTGAKTTGAAVTPAGAAADENKAKAVEMVLETVESLFGDRDDNLWGSMVKQTLKRKRPNFSENFHGYSSFSELLRDAERQGLLELQKDEKSGGYVILGFGPNA